MKISKSGGRKTIAAMISISALTLAACSSPEQRVEKYYKSGMEYLEKDDLPRANIQFQNALKINEEHVPTLIGLSQVAEDKEDYQTLFGILQRVLRLSPDNVDAHVRIGKLFLIGSDETSAMEHADRALELEPMNADAMGLKAGVLLTLGDTQSAVALARRALEINPTLPEAITVLASERAAQSDLAGAIGVIDNALDIDPSIAILQLLKINLLEKLGRSDEIAAAYQEIIENHPDIAIYRKAFAREMLKRQNYESAREQIAEAVRLEPHNFDLKMDYVRVIRLADGDAAAEETIRKFAAESDSGDIQFALLDFLSQIGKTDEADQLLKTLSESSEQETVIRAKNRIAAGLLAEGDLEAAEKIVADILAGDERNTDALLKRAAIKVAREEFDEAVIDIRTALDNDPENVDAIVMMGNAFEAQDNITFARNQYASAFEKDRSNVEIADRYARFLSRTGDLERAESVLEQTLALNPGNVKTLKLLASVRLSLQDWQGAEEVGALLAGHTSTSAQGDDIRAAALTGLAEYDRIIDLFSDRSETELLASAPLASLVQAYIRTGRSSEAAAYLQSVIAQDADNYLARILLAQTARVQQDAPLLEQTLLEAIEQEPARAEAYQLLYQYYASIGERARIEELLNKGLEAAPDNAALRVVKADIALAEQDYGAALEIYSALFAERPEDALIANNYLSLLSDSGADAGAVKAALEKASILETAENAFFMDTLGWAYYRAGDADRAAPLLEKSAEGEPKNPDILYHLGVVRAARGERESAAEALNKALEAGGDGYRFRSEIETLLKEL